jgi:GMP synthase-like glutamine amidotransferase
MREEGWLCIESTEAAGADRIFRNLQGTTGVFQLHEDTFDLPAGAVRLARSAASADQAFRLGEAIYGVQFHPEMTPKMAEDRRGVLGLPDWRPPAGAFRRPAATCETLLCGWKGLL